MLIHKADKLTVFMGDSLADAVQWVESTPRIWRSKGSVSNRAEQSWDLNAGYDGAVRLGSTGWDAGVQDLSGKLEAMVKVLHDKQPPWRYDVAGALPDVPRFLAGAPDPMMNHGRAKGNKPTVHIVVNVCVSAFASSTQIFNFGAALTALIDDIEHSGKRVQLDAVASFRFASGIAIVGWNVKRASEPVDLSAVAFSLAHPAAFRRLMFGMVERTYAGWETPGYGTVHSTIDAVARGVLDCQTAFVIEGVKADASACSTIDGALKLAQRQLAAAEAEQQRQLEGV